MASAWGNAWGDAWGDSWGTVSAGGDGDNVDAEHEAPMGGRRRHRWVTFAAVFFLIFLG